MKRLFSVLSTMSFILFFVLIVTAQTASLASAPSGEKNKTQSPSSNATETQNSFLGKDAESLIRGNNTFAFDLAERLFQKKGNVFFSPFSISDALAMTYAGARGKTETQMAKVLHFSLPQKTLHPALSSLLRSLQDTGSEGCILRVANALWGQKGYKFLQSFTDLIRRYYGGGFFRIDFSGDTEGARNRINRWIEKKTEEKIKDLISKGDLTPLTRLVLTNAIYFKGKWSLAFKKKNTHPLPFHVTPEKTVRAPMMYQKATFPYFRDKKIQVLELPYMGKALSMLILLPDRSVGVKGLQDLLTEKNFGNWLSQLRKRKVAIYLPRFKLKTRFYLAKILSDMGMPDAFTNTADFSGISGNRELMISKVIHQAYVNVNEEGTEAAAATAVAIRLKAVMMNYPVFKADHPFIFLILHKKTRSILFMGKVVNPAVK